jgi:hypothetical protein
MTPADDRRIRLASEGVIASYIHDISARTAPARRSDARADRLAHTRRALRRRDHRAGSEAGGMLAPWPGPGARRALSRST